jgi:hypothetical protein
MFHDVAASIEIQDAASSLNIENIQSGLCIAFHVEKLG